MAQRVLSSLVCPTAAGRLMRLSSPDQAAADCFGMYLVSYNPARKRGRIPLMAFQRKTWKTSGPSDGSTGGTGSAAAAERAPR